jgi:hypothetical protein
MNVEAIKGQAVAAISAYNVNQRSTVDMIDPAPWAMKIVSEHVVIMETIREIVTISRPFAGVFRVTSRIRNS